MESLKLIEYCESEKNEEERINKDDRRKKMILDDLEVVERGKAGGPGGIGGNRQGVVGGSPDRKHAHNHNT